MADRDFQPLLSPCALARLNPLERKQSRQGDVQATEKKQHADGMRWGMGRFRGGGGRKQSAQ